MSPQSPIGSAPARSETSQRLNPCARWCVEVPQQTALAPSRGCEGGPSPTKRITAGSERSRCMNGRSSSDFGRRSSRSVSSRKPSRAACLVQGGVDLPAHPRRDARDALELLAARREQPLGRAEVREQRTLARRARRRGARRGSTPSRARPGASGGSRARSDAPRPDALQELQAGRAALEHDRMRSARARRPPPRASQARSPPRGRGRARASPRAPPTSCPLPPSTTTRFGQVAKPSSYSSEATETHPREPPRHDLAHHRRSRPARPRCRTPNLR